MRAKGLLPFKAPAVDSMVYRLYSAKYLVASTTCASHFMFGMYGCTLWYAEIDNAIFSFPNTILRNDMLSTCKL